jgi:flagellar protein FliS
MNAGTFYQQNAIQGASPLELVLTMYDMLIADMNRAIAALRSGDVEARTNEVKHALDVLAHLQSGLNFETGGDTANSLDTLYGIVRGKLLQAHIQQSVPLFQQQIDMINYVRDAWKEVQRRLAQPAPSSMYGDAMMPPPSMDAEAQMSNWRA